MEKKQLVKSILIILAGIILLMAVQYRGTRAQPPEVFLGQSDQQQVVAPQDTAGTERYLIDENIGERISYEAVLRAFAGKTLQVNERCQLTPKTMTIEKGEQFLVDNKSDTHRRIHFGNRMYTIKPYDFAIAIIPKSGTIYVQCNNEEKVAVIDVTE